MPIFSRLLQRLVRRGEPRAGSIADFEASFTVALQAVLDYLDDTPSYDLTRFRKLHPIFYDRPDWVDRDLVPGDTDRDYTSDLLSFVRSQKQTRDTGVWNGYTTMQTVQADFWTRMIRRSHKTMLGEIVPAEKTVQAPIVGPVTVYALLCLHNILCLHARLQASWLIKIPGIGFSLIKYDLKIRDLQNSIQTLFIRISNCTCTIGDVFFLHSMTHCITEFQQDQPAYAYMHRLVQASPWTVLSRIEDDTVWRYITEDNLKDLFRILILQNQGYPVCETLMQQWVDALVAADEARRGMIFERINSLVRHLLETDRSASTPDDVDQGYNNRRCILIFIRLLVRSWPDGPARDACFGSGDNAEMKKVAFWRVGFTRITTWLEEASHGIDRAVWRKWLPVAEENILKQCLILTERSS